jgi:hypothetical protein
MSRDTNEKKRLLEVGLRDVEKAPALGGISGRVWDLCGNIKGSPLVCARG